MATKEFSGKIVFLTGAGSGIGYQTARAFAARGADILATDIEQTGLDDIQAEVEKLGRRCLTRILDVRDETAFTAIATELESLGTIPDIVVNNAGLGVIKSFADTSPSDWRLTLDVNVLGVVFGCRAFLEVWQRRGTVGHFVNVSSMASIVPMPNMAAYVASKYAVEGLSDSLAMELANTDIAVTCVHPGVINTPIVQNEARFGISAAQIEKLQNYYRDVGDHPRVVAEDIVSGVGEKARTVLSGTGTSAMATMKRTLPREAFHNQILNEARKMGFLPE